MINPVLRTLGTKRTRDLRSPDVIGQLFMLLMLVVIAIGAGVGSALTVALGATAFVVSGGGILWSRLSLQEVKYEASLSDTHIFVDDEVNITMTLENRKPLPVPWVQLIEFVPSGLLPMESDDARQRAGLQPLESDRVRRRAYAGGSELVETTSMSAYERVRFHHPVRAMHRGHFRLGPTEMRSGDLFGLFGSIRRDQGSMLGVTVYPKIVAIDGFFMPAARPFGDVLNRNTLIDDLSRPKSVREYRPGDPMKRIDWKLSAKQGELTVRTFDQSVSNDVVILLESATVDTAWHGYKYDVLEGAVTGVASIAARCVELGYRVGFVGNGVRPGRGVLSVIPPGDGSTHLRSILEALAFVHPLSFLPLEKLILERGFHALPSGSSIVLVAGLLREGVVNYLLEASGRGHNCMVIWVGRESAPQVTGLRVLDMREQFKLEGDVEDFLFSVEDAAQEERSRFSRPASESFS